MIQVGRHVFIVIVTAAAGHRHCLVKILIDSSSPLQPLCLATTMVTLGFDQVG